MKCSDCLTMCSNWLLLFVQVLEQLFQVLEHTFLDRLINANFALINDSSGFEKSFDL